MRRLLSILLLAAFALPLVAPLFALAQDSDAGLPACCRRHGHHHCAMLDRQQDPLAHRFVAVCPFYPQHQAAYLTRTQSVASQPPRPIAIFVSAVPYRARTETHRTIERGRSNSERGPPPMSFAIF